MQAIAIRPTVLNMKDLGTQTAIAAQKQVIFNQLIKQGSTNLLNFGKNTQWAGRQLMVGFTLPLATLGMTAGRVFMDMETAAIKFRKVYGDLFTPDAEREKAMEGIVELGKEFTAYGVAVDEALSMAADAAAAGFAGADLQNQTAAALKLSVLGQLDLNKALETTISLQNAFGISSKDLAEEIDFLNAVENQTVISLDDMTTAIPKAGPVVQSLGGDVRDLAFFMAAMKEGGINASEGANALKSGLASLINPTQRARDMLSGFGVNLRGIIDQNEGDVTGVVVGFARALDELDPLNRAQAIEQMFGKFQFARLSTLFANVAKDGTQASRVLDLAGASLEELAALSEDELGVAAASSMNKFLAAVERIKIALAPIGETFLQIATPIIDFGTKMLEAFNNLPDGIKKSIATVITVIGGIGPIALMTFGLINNGIANMIKFFATVRLGYLRITGQAKGVGDETQYMTNEQLEAAAAAASLDQAHSNLTQRFTAEKVAVDALRASYEAAVAAGNRFALLNPGMMKPGSPAKFAKGGFVSGSGTGDTVPAMLTPGEYVINKQAAQEMMPLLEAINNGQVSKFEDGGAVGRNVSLAGKSFDTFGTRSAKAIDRFIESMISSGTSLDSISKLLDKVEAQFGKLSSGNVQAAAKSMGLVKEKERSAKLERMHLQEDLSVLPTGERVMGSLVRPGLQLQNQQLRGKGQAPEQFMSDWTSVKDGLVDTLNLGGMEITDEVREMAQAIDTEIAEAAVILAKATEKGLVDDKILAKATEDVIKTNKELGGSRAQIAQTMTERAGARVLAPATKESLLTAGVIQEGETWTGWVRGLVADGVAKLKQGTGEIQVEYADGVRTIARVKDEAVRAALADLSEIEQKAALVSGKIGDQRLDITTGNRSALDPNTYLDTPTAKTKAVVIAEAKELGKQEAKARMQGNKEVIEATQDPYLDKRDRNSPHPQAAKDGADDAKAYDGAFQEQKSMVAARGPRRAASSGGNVIWDEQSKQYQNQAKMAQILDGRQRGLARATQATINQVQTFSKRVAGAGIGITSVAGIFTMFGGTVGQVAGIIMQVAGLFTTLALVTSQLIATQRAKLAMDMVTNLRSGKTATGAISNAGGFLGGAKGMAGIKNLFGNVGKVAKEFLPILGKIPKGAGKLTAALVALAAVFSIGKVVFENLMKPFRLLGETANLSSDKLKTLGELLNVQIREADFASKFTGTTANTAEEKAQVTVLLESEEFQAEFADQIQGIKAATAEDAQRALNALALQLSASNFDAAAVEAIINAIVIEAGQKDLNLEFASIDFKSADGLASITRLATESSAKLTQAFESQDIGDALLGWFGGGQLKAQVQTTAGEFASLYEALQIGFSNGEISAEDFTTQVGNLSSKINELNPAMAKQVVDTLAGKLGIEDNVKGLDNFNDKLLVINATAAGVEIPEKVVRALERASKAGANKKDLQTAIKLRTEINELIKTETELREEQREQEELQELQTAAVEEARASISEQIETLQNQSTAYDILTEAGFGAARAIDIVGDAAIAQALALAATDAERKNIINDLITLENFKRDAERRTQAATGGGGGGSKSPMQQALEDLGKQRTEIKNNIAAYAGLRKAGFSAAEAAEVAGDATLAAALASTQVGSSQWKALVNQIRLVRIEALKTSEGLRNAFDGLKNQADEYYDILKQQVERKYADGLKAAEKQAKALNRAIEDLNDVTEDYQEQIDDIQRNIEIQFDRPIEALNEETSDLANDLAIMDKEADKITKRYDEQAEALDRVNKINQRIIAQQKQQIGLSSALVEGDIAAAAAAVQDIRASNADAAGQSQGEMLDVAKQAELDALRSESGMSRLEIEERQFEISQEIYDLEEQREGLLADIQVIEDAIYDIQENKIEPLENQLELNEDIVQAIEDQRDAELEAIEAQEQKWEDAELALNLARIKAGDFNEAIEMAKGLTGDVVADWNSLADQTRILTIKTVLEGLGGPATDAPIVQESGGGGGGSDDPIPEPQEVDETAVTEEQAKGPLETAFAWLEDAGSGIGNWWDGILSSIGDAWQGIVDGFLTPINNVFIAIGSMIDTLILEPLGNLWDETGGKWLAAFGEWLSDIWAGITSWYDATIGPWWDDTIGAFFNGIGDWFEGVFDSIGSGLESAGAWIGEKASDVGTWFEDAGKNVSNWWDGVLTGWNDLQEDPVKTGQDWAKSIQGSFGDAATSVSNWFEDVGTELSNNGADLWSRIQNIGDWLATQWENFMTWMTVDLPEGVAAWGGEVWGNMQNVGDWLATQWENWKTWATVTLPEGIKQWGADTWSGIQNIGEWLSTQWENFKTWLTVTLPEGINQWGADTWSGIQNIGDWLTTQWNNFKTWLTVTLPNGIVGWARTLWTSGMPNLSSWLATKAEELRIWIQGLPAKIGNWAVNLWDNFWSGFSAGESNTRGAGKTGKGSATGGMIYRNAGGDVPGIGNTDTVPAMLTPGEFVMNKRSTSKYRPALKAMNAGSFAGGMAANRYKVQPPRYSPLSFSKDVARNRYSVQPPTYPTSDFSESVYNVPSRGDQASNGNLAMIAPQSTTATQFDNPVYNYSLSVNVNGSNASANDIASTVMDRIKRVDSQRLRKQVIR
jgi:TP901 family phage tail tape measure protein